MWHLIHLIARPIEALLGVFCVLSAIALYPDEEGKVQSKFEDFWVSVDDFKNLALTRHAAFMTQVAKLESRFLDNLFGHKLLSPQSIAVSACCSIVSYFLVYICVMRIVFKHNFSHLLILMVYVLVGPLGVAVAYGVLRTRHFARKVLLLVASLFVAGELASYVYRFGFLPTARLGSEIITLATLGFVCDVAFIAATRQLIRLAGEMKQSLRVTAVVVLDLLLAAVLVGPLYLYFWILLSNRNLNYEIVGLIYSGYVVAQTNALDAALALLFVSLALLLLIHRALWPLLPRTLFRIQEMGIKGRRAILTAVGLALLSASVFGGKFPELLKEIVKSFGG
jgi:hypothetical protein